MDKRNGLRCAFLVAIGILMFVLLMIANASAATTTIVPDDYTNIQWAIDNATAGDTIEVHSGTYYENVNVNKQLTLHGIGMPEVNATLSGSAISLSADGIILEGISATGAYDAGIRVTSNNNMLLNNNASNNRDRGINLDFSNNNTLIGNNASDNYYGIYLFTSSNNTLIGNNASNNSKGIYLWSSSNNLIYNNIFNNTNNLQSYDMTINQWNITKQSGNNILGGSFLGGNFWAQPDSNGFGQLCPDDNMDGICNKQYTLDSENIDYLPLSTKYRIKGDVDDDGTITASDALLYLRYAVHQNIAPYHMDESYDVTCDGNIYADDALLVLRRAVNQPVVLICPRP